jgi:hypothetical protein
LGKTPDARNEIISKVLQHLDKIDFALEDTEIDVLGDGIVRIVNNDNERVDLEIKNRNYNSDSQNKNNFESITSFIQGLFYCLPKLICGIIIGGKD